MLPKPSSKPPSATDGNPETHAPNQSTLPPVASPPPGDPAPSALQPGARPVPHYPDYELVRKLGAGGFGEVWQARGPGGIDVALKFIRLDARGSELEVRSLDVMRTIRHPNLAGLFGVWRTDTLLILAMELCDRSLQDRLNEALKQNLPGIPAKELLGYMRGAAEGLDALHDKQVQHRDVKPANLLLLQKGVKVADFGLAKVMEQTAASHTGALTLAYAAPEFFKGETTTQSDQYSLAATYVHLRTGRLLFEGSYHQVVYGHMSVSPDLSQLPAAERAVVARALAKEPQERWPECAAFAEALVEARHSEPQEEKKKTATDTERIKKGSERKRSWFWPVAACLLLLLPVGYFGGKEVLNLLHRTEVAKSNNANEKKPDLQPDSSKPLRQGALHLALGPWDMLPLDQLASNAEPPKPEPPVKKPELPKPDPVEKPEPPRPEPPVKKPEPPQPSILPATLTVDLGDGVKMEFVLIPKGKFQMGSPPDEKERNPFEKDFDAEKLHEVEISKPFYLAKYPVTQEQYQALMKDNPSWFQKGEGGADKLKGTDTKQFPVEQVSWGETQAFCKKMKDRDKQSHNFRLPTEAEWEYACRAGTTTPFSFGSVLNGEQANCNGNWPYGTNDKGPYKERTTKVGEYGENKWGLCDMHGNVYQWCEDYYGPYNDDLNSTDPLRSLKYSEERRVLRGGSWSGHAGGCRAAYRLRRSPGDRLNFIGFRVAFRLD